MPIELFTTIVEAFESVWSRKQFTRNETSAPSDCLHETATVSKRSPTAVVLAFGASWVHVQPGGAFNTAPEGWKRPLWRISPSCAESIHRTGDTRGAMQRHVGLGRPSRSAVAAKHTAVSGAAALIVLSLRSMNRAGEGQNPTCNESRDELPPHAPPPFRKNLRT